MLLLTTISYWMNNSRGLKSWTQSSKRIKLSVGRMKYYGFSWILREQEIINRVIKRPSSIRKVSQKHSWVQWSKVMHFHHTSHLMLKRIRKIKLPNSWRRNAIRKCKSWERHQAIRLNQLNRNKLNIWSRSSSMALAVLKVKAEDWTLMQQGRRM